MVLCMLPYYFLKDSLMDIPNHIQENLNMEEDFLFNVANFNSLGVFYKIMNPFKKDKYNLHERLLSNKFNSFLWECIEHIKIKNDYNQLLLIYAMTSYRILFKHIQPFLKANLPKHLSIEKAYNMLDFYCAKTRDNIDLRKICLPKYFKNGFIYHEFMEDLVHNPFIKIYNFFCSKEYFTHSMKRKIFFYRHCTRSKMKLKYIPYKIYDILLNHRGKPKAIYYLYTGKINTTLLNISKNSYTINEESYSYSFEEAYQNALMESKEMLDAINQYICYDHDKNLKRILNLEEHK